MAIPLFFETPRIVAVLPELGEDFTLVELLARAGLTCQASGAWTLRRVRLVRGSTDLLREPGDVGAVLVGVPAGQARRATHVSPWERWPTPSWTAWLARASGVLPGQSRQG